VAVKDIAGTVVGLVDDNGACVDGTFDDSTFKQSGEALKAVNI